jgi:AcrR family transcriptional regulator
MRYKEFNRNKVLEICIRLFWKNGFRACAISDIVVETGVNRFSLYEEFGSKEGILFAALKLYKKRYSDLKLEILQRPTSIESTLENYYLSFLQNTEIQDGCFVIHVGTELADTDSEVQLFLKSYLAEIESNFVLLLETEDSLQPNIDVVAKNLIGLFCTTMSFCLIHTEQNRINHIRNGVQVILTKTKHYA